MSGKSKKSYKKHGKILGLIIATSILLFSQLLPLFPSPHAYAYENNDNLPIHEQQARTELYGLMECIASKNQSFKGMAGTSNPSTDDVTNHRIWNNESWGVSVGFEISPKGDNSDPGTILCQDINYDAALGFLNDSKMATYDDFEQFIYKKDSNGNWTPKSSDIDTKLLNLLKSDANKRKQSASSVFGPDERKRRALVGLAQCLTASSDPSISDVTLNGQAYNWRNEKSKGSSQVLVGNDWQPDGQMQCQTLLGIVKSTNAMQTLPQGVTLDNLFNNPQALDGGDVIASAPGATPGAGADAGGGGGGVSCDLGIKDFSVGGVLNAINPLNWLLCGIVKGMNLIVTSLDDQINSMLVLGTGGNPQSDNPNHIFADSSGNCGAKNGVCDNYYTAWQSFQRIALGLLVIVGLIIVISQALGMEILDAYTIRKMLPRVLIATIAIVLSWQIMRFFVTVSNDLGYGVGSLLDAPFHGLGQSIKVGGTSGLLATFALALGGVFFDLFGMLAFVGTAALAVIITFLVLTLRQIAVILLIIFSPIAILAYVLPNTQRLYKFWWESFSKLLLMFPMIVAFITAGHIFSAISSSEGGGFVQQTIAFIAYFGPYFAIPLTFRFAGGLMSTAGNAVNARGEGARGLLRGVRSNRAKYNAERLKSGTRFESRIPGTSRIQGGLNKATRGIGTGFRGRFGLGATGSEARAQVGIGAKNDLLRTPGMQAIKGKNDVNRILAEGMGNEADGRRGLKEHLMQGGDDGKFGQGMTFEAKSALADQKVDQAARAAKVAGGFTTAHGAAALYNMAQDGTAIRDTDDLARLSAKAGQGNANATFTYAAETASMSRQAGRSDLAAASEPIGELAFAHSDRIYKKGLLHPDSNVGDMELGKLRFAAWQSGNGGEVAYSKFSSAKGRTVRNDTRTAVDVLKSHQAAVKTGVASPYSEDEVQFAAATLLDTKNAIDSNYGKVNNRADAGKELAKDEGALDFYLKTKTTVHDTQQVASRVADGTPIYSEPSERTTTNEELVKKIVGDRYASMSPEQRAEMEARRTAGGGGDEEEGEP